MGGRGTNAWKGTGGNVKLKFPGGNGKALPNILSADKDMNLAGMTAKDDAGGFRYTSVQKTLDKLETEALKLDREELKIIDDNGFVVAAVYGDKESVGLSLRAFREVKGKTFTHNHPRERDTLNGGTFSPADINSLKFGMKELRASAREGTYSLKAKGNKQDAKGFYNHMKKNKSKIERSMNVAGNKVRPQDFSSKQKYTDAVFNAQMGALSDWYAANAAKYGYQYTFTPR